MSDSHQRAGFTLIELMVTTAIIVALVAIFVPSLSRARAQARTLQCEANVKQLVTGFLMYTVQNNGRLPGCDFDPGADWLGSGNRTAPKSGRQPLDGTLFTYVGRQLGIYGCPDDRTLKSTSVWYRSYSSNFLLCGARPESLAGAHYRESRSNGVSYFSDTNHTRDMRSFGGVPLVMEEDALWNLSRYDNAAWANTDCVSDRHPSTRGPAGTIGYTDSHVATMTLHPRRDSDAFADSSFCANDHCIQTAGGRWITGKSWGVADFKYVDHARPAAVYGVSH